LTSTGAWTSALATALPTILDAAAGSTALLNRARFITGSLDATALPTILDAAAGSTALSARARFWWIPAAANVLPITVDAAGVPRDSELFTGTEFETLLTPGASGLAAMHCTDGRWEGGPSLDWKSHTPFVENKSMSSR
jgi:hypothetical protein